MFKKTLSKADKDFINEFKDKRVYPRYLFSDLVITEVKFPSGLEGKIRDLSYSGVAVSFPEGTELDKIENKAAFTIKICGLSINVTATLVYATKATCGFHFHHGDPSILLFLRNILEFCRYGSTMVELDKAIVQDKYKGAEWMVLRGDGPTDLTVNIQPGNSHEIHSALLTFLDGKTYRHLRFLNDMVFSGLAIDPSTSGAVSSRMQETAEIDMDVLRKGIFVLLGVEKPELRKISAKLLPILYNHFRPT